MLAKQVEINLVKTLLNLSLSLESFNPGIMTHHKRVALIALNLGTMVNLTGKELLELFKAAIIHDIGAVTWQEKLLLKQFDVEDPWSHCEKGSCFFEGIPDLALTAEIIRSHHDHWLGNNHTNLLGNRIPLASRIIHLADRVAVLIQPQPFILEQRSQIMNKIQSSSGTVFDPDLVGILVDLAKMDRFWFDITSPWIDTNLKTMVPAEQISLFTRNLSGFAQLFARVVDSKSPFTYRHSSYVANVAKALARHAGLPANICYLVDIAGLLHDIGKLGIPEEIIEKPGALSKVEFDLVKQHSYYTYWLLNPVNPDLPLAKWAAYHHERLDGKGYPFNKSGEDLDLEARIIAVADVFTALREDRPYRPGMSWSGLESIINQMVVSGGLDGEVVSLLFANRSELDELWFGH